MTSLRVALNAAEPVRAETLRGFERMFELKNVMAAGYGLAEATVGVAMTTPGTAPKVDARGNVSVGPPFPGVAIEIRREGRVCIAGETGDIHLHTPAKSDGYFDDPVATAALFDARGFIATGDYGYLDRDGELFVVGRTKNSIIVAGRTIAPREIEEAAEVDASVRFAAAIGIDRGHAAGEQVVVFAELRDTALSAEQRATTSRAIVRAVFDKIAIRPADVVLLAAHAIPLTHNGKVQHARLRELYLESSLARLDASPNAE